jgi:putative ABC transport system permease protein
MIRNYFKTAWRHLVKQKVSTLINLFGLTVGITICLVIYLITSYELSYDQFHPDKDQLYRLVGQAHFGSYEEKHPVGFIPNAVPQAIRQEIPKIETIAAFHVIETEVVVPSTTEEPKRFERRKPGLENAEIVVVEPQYFDLFKYQWLVGTPQTALSEPFKVVLSQRKAHHYFGHLPLDKIVGKELIYLDSIRVTVAGIIQDWNQPTNLTFTDFISFPTIQASPLKKAINLDVWEGLDMASQAYVKLAQGTTPAQLASSFQAFSKKHFQNVLIVEPQLQPLLDIHFNADYYDTYSRQTHLPTLYGLMGLAAFILLLAAINFINLATAQSVQRGKEISLRKVLGSSRKSLITQFLGETALLTLTATILSFIIVGPVISSLQTLMPPGLAFSLITPNVLIFIALIIITTSLLAGFYPALVLSSYLPALTLKGHYGFQNGQNAYARKGLIVFQFIVSVVFIIGALMIGRQLRFMHSKDWGFSSDAVIEVSTKGDKKSLVLAQKIKQLSDVDRVTMQWAAPMSESIMMGKLKFRGKTNKEFDVMAKAGDENFIPLYHLRLLAGRNYRRSDTLREVIINATLAKELGFKQPAEALNKLVDWRNKLYPIVGVVADFHEQSFHELIKPTLIGYMPREAKNIGIKLATKDRSFDKLKETLARIDQQWQTVYPDDKLEYTFVDDSIAKLFVKERKTAQLVNTATVIALLISCMGLFGLVTFTTQQRIKEIGIRKVLGASVSSIVALLSKDFVQLILIAFLIGSPIAWWLMQEWLQAFAYKAELSWWVFALAYLLILGIALLTVSFQSIKAALTDPVKNLRAE